MPETVRTRFAPSPTGALHVGGVRTALFDWLWAKKNGGTFILRIEDTDQDRLQPESIAQITEALEWLGLTPDEGPQQGGPYGPYVQSERLSLYQKAAGELVEKNAAYLCFCTEERLKQLREEQAAQKLPPKYDRLCRRLSESERKEKLLAGAAHVIRLAVPEEGSLEAKDHLRGTVHFSYREQDDAVLLKSDGFPTYHLANVVDDHEMRITHVFRGEEWLPSLPKHLLVYQAFGWTPPEYIHLPLILGTDRAKLSKRHGAASVLEFRTQGYLPEALVNFLAFLGWNPKTDQELFSREELIQAFSIDQLNKSAGIFNLEKLDWFNSQIIRTLPKEERERILNEILAKAFPKASFSPEKITAIVELVGERIVRFEDVPPLVSFLFAEESYDPSILVPKGGEHAETIRQLTRAKDFLGSVSDEVWTAPALHEAIDEHLKETPKERKAFLWPLRVSITFRAASPGVFEVLAFLGKSESLTRITKAIQALESTGQKS